MNTLKQLIVRLALVLGLLGVVGVASVGQEVALDAKPAAAQSADHFVRYDVVSVYHRYDIQIWHQTNGMNLMHIHQFTRDGSQYIGLAVRAQTWDYACFFPDYVGDGTVRINIWANAATDGWNTHSQPNNCQSPWQTVNPHDCLGYHVYSRNGVFYSYNPSYRRCWGSGEGWIQYGYWQPLRQQYPLVAEGATDNRADFIQLY